MTLGSFNDPGCNGDKHDCDETTSWQCYYNNTLQYCCSTCRDYEIHPLVPGCEFGDKRPDCDVDEGRRCYDNTVRSECCLTCQSYELNYIDCRYGDKLRDCRQNECTAYTIQGKRDCCFTCRNVTSTTWAPTSTRSTWSPTQWNTNYSTSTEASKGMPSWVVPAAASGGGVLLLMVVVLMCILYLRNNKTPDHLSSPIDERTYNEYKLSKRAPMALPRGPETEKDWTRERKPSAEYSYINPEDVCSHENTNNNRPLPAAPAEYLDLEAYSYAGISEAATKPDTYTQLSDVPKNKPDDGSTKPPSTIPNPYQAYPPERKWSAGSKTEGLSDHL